MCCPALLRAGRRSAVVAWLLSARRGAPPKGSISIETLFTNGLRARGIALRAQNLPFLSAISPPPNPILGLLRDRT